MRIAQVAPLYERVPPVAYGGTERVVSYLTEELVRQGHQVTLYASGDSVTSANLRPISPRALRLDPTCVDPLAHHILLLERVAQESRDHDIIHFHIDYLHFPLSRALNLATITTLHGRLDLPELPEIYREFREMPVVSISSAQRGPLGHANWVGTVHHGLPLNGFTFNPSPEGYLAFIGRISPEKGVDRAIEIATRIEIPLKIAAKVDRIDRDYFEQIRPLLNHPLVEFLGEVGGEAKNAFLGNARALLFPIDWPEPFGLAMIEAMACGTPVVAFKGGSVVEVVDEGITGNVVDSIPAATAALHQIDRIDRGGCRKRFEERFSAERMATDYLEIYRKILCRPLRWTA